MADSSAGLSPLSAQDPDLPATPAETLSYIPSLTHSDVPILTVS